MNNHFDIDNSQLKLREYKEKTESFIEEYLRLRGFVKTNYFSFRKKGLTGVFNGNIFELFFDEKTNILLISTFGVYKDIEEIFSNLSKVEFMKENKIRIVLEEK